ncbi:ashwin [Aplochiton taeniatus]
MASYINTEQKDKWASNAGLLLHPELLSEEFLRHILQERKIPFAENVSRDHLMELFLRNVIPLPQRPLPDSRWGRRMQQSRARREAQSRDQSYSSKPNDHNRKRPLIVFDGSSSSGPVRLKKPEGATASGLTDRLKPPPSMNISNPIRKLSNSSRTQPSPSSSPSPARGFESPNKSLTGNGSAAAPSTANLKREADSKVPGNSPEAKKKIHHVSWP